MLGIRMERMPVDGNLPENKEQIPGASDGLPSTRRSSLVLLPGDVLHGLV